MLDKDDNLIMVDFGESSRFLEEDDVLGGSKGTLLYRAPEYYLDGYSGNKTINLRPVDIWAAGASLRTNIFDSKPYGYVRANKC